MKKSGKVFFRQLIFLFLLTGFNAFSLDFTDITNGISDRFAGFTGDYEGLTSFRSLNIPEGGRAESMGTAFTAVADDISFFEYNPAASAVLDTTQAAFFHNSWIADSAMETLSGTIRHKNLGFGAQFKCFYVPFTEYNLFGDRVAGNYYSETSFTLNMAYNFFAGYDFKGLAAGFNLKGSWRNVPDYTDNKTDEIIDGSGLSQSAYALMVDAGILLRFNFIKVYNDLEPNLKIGISINNLGFATTGFGNDFSLDSPLPFHINAGISYRLFQGLMFTGEWRLPVNLSDTKHSEKWSVASGVELNITKIFALDTGFLLQGANPRFSLGSQFDVKGVKMSVNYTLDLTTSLNPLNHISVSAKMILGDRGRKNTMLAIQKKYAEGIALYSQGTNESINKAIEKWQETRELSKLLGIKYDPAIEAINAARTLLNTHQLINTFGTLEKSK